MSSEHETDADSSTQSAASPTQSLHRSDLCSQSQSERAPGSTPYELLRQTGRGGMGNVWLAAEQQPIKRIVATKVIRPEFAVGEMLVRGTEANAETACGLERFSPIDGGKEANPSYLELRQLGPDVSFS